MEENTTERTTKSSGLLKICKAIGYLGLSVSAISSVPALYHSCNIDRTKERIVQRVYKPLREEELYISEQRAKVESYLPYITIGLLAMLPAMTLPVIYIFRDIKKAIKK